MIVYTSLKWMSVTLLVMGLGVGIGGPELFAQSGHRGLTVPVQIPRNAALVSGDFPLRLASLPMPSP